MKISDCLARDMTLKDLEFPIMMDTSSNNLVEEFFRPVLSQAIEYDRGVGYFTSGWLKANSEGILQFVQNGGHARWVTSPILSKDDWETMCLGDKAKQDATLYKVLLESVQNLEQSLEVDVLSALAWLIADNIIEFRIALPRGVLSGEFHDKFGIFTDEEGNKISFSGSYNDSIHGLQNYESIKIFQSWENRFDVLVNAEQARFNRLWENKDPNVLVFIFPEAVKRDIFKLKKPERPYDIKVFKEKFEARKYVSLLRSLNLRDYQKDAIDAWKNNNFKGIFEMATGTGKTRAAIGCMLVSLLQENIKVIIVSCPQHTILTQWIKDCEDYKLPLDSSVIVDSTNHNWRMELQQKLLELKIGSINNLAVFTLHPTSSSIDFQRAIEKKDRNHKIFFIGDEVHGLGAEKSCKALNPIYNFRLGLSATPKRWYDDDGSKKIYDYFGDVVFEFSIKDALDTIDPSTGKPYLSPYYYYPVPVSLSEEELLDFYELTKSIKAISHKKDDKKIQDILNLLRIKRAEIHKDASNKIPKLKELIDSIENFSGTIIFTSPNQLLECQKLLHEKRVTCHKFTESESSTPSDKFGGISEREYLIQKFKDRSINILIAIKCLDEGIDVPNARAAILMSSSTNPREYIQRIGRVIRPSTDKEFAIIYDFIVIPSHCINDPIFRDLEKKLFEKELIRIEEIATNALNNATAIKIVHDISRSDNEH